MRAVALLAAFALVPLASGGSSGIAPADASALATAIAAGTGLVTGADLEAQPPLGTPAAVADTALASFPTAEATYGILGTGDATAAGEANTAGDRSAANGGPNARGDTDFDVVVLRIDVKVPQGANCLTIDFRFLSEEFPEFVGKEFNDAFVAELDSSTWTTKGSAIEAPRNFAFDPAGNPISVNATGATSVSAENAAGTTYDAATPLLSASTPVTPGQHSLFLSIFDQGDDAYDSAVFLDNLDVGAAAEGQCRRGARVGGGGGGGGTPPPGQVTGQVTGTVLVNGQPYTGGPIPYGAVIDATKGTVKLTSNLGSGVFFGGVFVLARGFETSRTTSGTAAKPKKVALIELRLHGGNFKKACGKAFRAPASTAAKPKPKPVRSLWGNGKGRFRTKGKFASATVRGTFWLTQDRCDGTLVRVKQGKVEVLDFRRKKKVTLKAGQSYLAKAS